MRNNGGFEPETMRYTKFELNDLQIYNAAYNHTVRNKFSGNKKA